MNASKLALLKEHLRPKADGIELPGTDLGAIRTYLEDFRQRPVHIVAHSLGPEIIGSWVATDTADYIFYEGRTSAYHQRHIVLHEACHIIQGHQGPAMPRVASRLAPHLDPKLIRSLLCRSAFDTEQESEAEVLATLIEERLDRSTGPTIHSASPKNARDITEFFERGR